MLTNWRSVVLGIVICVSAADALAQDRDYDALAKVIAAGDANAEELATHRLTRQNVRQLFAVDRELAEAMKADPSVKDRIAEVEKRFDPEGRAGSGDFPIHAQVYEAVPEIAQILRRHKMTGREYWLTKLQAVVSAIWAHDLKPEALQTAEGREFARSMPPALKFWISMPPDLKAEADEWKKSQGLADAARGGVMR